jgi:hypothetical protein
MCYGRAAWRYPAFLVHPTDGRQQRKFPRPLTPHIRFSITKASSNHHPNPPSQSHPPIQLTCCQITSPPCLCKPPESRAELTDPPPPGPSRLPSAPNILVRSSVPRSSSRLVLPSMTANSQRRSLRRLRTRRLPGSSRCSAIWGTRPSPMASTAATCFTMVSLTIWRGLRITLPILIHPSLWTVCSRLLERG